MKTKVNKPENSGKNSQSFFSKKAGAGFFSGQAKLNVGQPNDKYEQEADRVADQVINRQSESQSFFTPSQPQATQAKLISESVTPLVQKQEEEEEEAQTKPENTNVQRQKEEEEPQAKLEIQRQPEEEEEELIQPKLESNSAKRQNSTEQLIAGSKGGGSPLNSSIQTEMENGFGADFSNVNIHTDSRAVQMNKELGARAFTSGNNIFFNSGQFQPGSESGKKLLAHELTHTIQQGASTSQPSIQKWPFSLTTEQQKTLFRSRAYGPVTISRGGPGAGFDASYDPRASRLNITVRGKVRFANGLSRSGRSFTSPNRSMREAGFIPILKRLPAEVQNRILPYFQFSETEKQVHLRRFTRNLRVVENMYQNTGMSFQVAESGWEDVTATPRVNLDITEGNAVHATNTVNLLGTSFTFTNPQSSDHLQVEIVKQPSMSEYRAIRQIVADHDASISVTRGMVRGVRSSQGNDRGSRRTAPAGFNNLMSLRSNAVDALGDLNYNHSVFFEHNQSILSEESRQALHTFFSDPMILWDRYDRGVDITLSGYASAPGSTDYNMQLVESRLDTIENYVNAAATRAGTQANVQNNIWRSNDADLSAEEDQRTNPLNHDPGDFRRVDIAVNRTDSRDQNTLAHEMGHVFGLGDEYVGGSRNAGDAARHGPWAQSAGISEGANVANDNRLMSGGNEFRAAYYSPFAHALDRLTSKHWHIIR